jgi:hypothetical protein
MREPTVRIVPNALNVVDPRRSTVIYVVFDPTTKDYPGRYVVRRQIAHGGEIWIDAEPTGVTRTLEDARDTIPDIEALTRLAKDPDEDPNIVECWV